MKVIVYPSFASANRPAGHEPKLSVIESPQPIDDVFQSSPEFNESRLDDDEFQCSPENFKLFTQAELNDLVRDLDSTNGKAELLGPRLTQKIFIGIWNVYLPYRTRSHKLAQ